MTSLIPLMNRITGLPNRHRLYQQGLATYDGMSPRYQVLRFVLIRIIGTETLVDTFGPSSYEVGLFLYSRTILAVTSSNGELFHLRDQEFLWVTSLRGRELAARLNRLTRAILAPKNLRGLRIRCRSVMGISTYPRDGRSISRLLSRADSALRHATKMGVVRQYYALGITLQESHRQALVTDLSRCLSGDTDCGVLEVHIQPEGTISPHGDGGFCVEVSSGEVLLRWRHPTRGLVPNVEFIPLAEEVGLIDALGKWILFGLIQTPRAHPSAGPAFSFSLNVSACQLEGNEFRNLLQSLVARKELDPGQIILELTETAQITAPKKLFENLGALKSIGFRISIDDYGTGFTSQSELKDFEFDEIKIDKSLVDDLGENRKVGPIIRSLCTLGADLGISVVAEGVEKAWQLVELHRIGIRVVQGYILSRPLPAERFFELYSGQEPIRILGSDRDGESKSQPWPITEVPALSYRDLGDPIETPVS